jgi:hypothetical protein
VIAGGEREIGTSGKAVRVQPRVLAGGCLPAWSTFDYYSRVLEGVQCRLGREQPTSVGDDRGVGPVPVQVCARGREQPTSVGDDRGLEYCPPIRAIRTCTREQTAMHAAHRPHRPPYPRRPRTHACEQDPYCRCTCMSVKARPSPGADVGRGEPSPGADVGRCAQSCRDGGQVAATERRPVMRSCAGRTAPSRAEDGYYATGGWQCSGGSCRRHSVVEGDDK